MIKFSSPTLLWQRGAKLGAMLLASAILTGCGTPQTLIKGGVDKDGARWIEFSSQKEIAADKMEVNFDPATGHIVFSAVNLKSQAAGVIQARTGLVTAEGSAATDLGGKIVTGAVEGVLGTAGINAIGQGVGGLIQAQGAANAAKALQNAPKLPPGALSTPSSTP